MSGLGKTVTVSLIPDRETITSTSAQTTMTDIGLADQTSIITIEDITTYSTISGSFSISPTFTSNSTSASSSLHKGAIVGGAISGGIGLMIVLILLWRRSQYQLKNASLQQKSTRNVDEDVDCDGNFESETRLRYRMIPVQDISYNDGEGVLDGVQSGAVIPYRLKFHQATLTTNSNPSSHSHSENSTPVLMLPSEMSGTRQPTNASIDMGEGLNNSATEEMATTQATSRLGIPGMCLYAWTGEGTVIMEGIPTNNTIDSNSYSHLRVKVGRVGGVITLIIVLAFIVDMWWKQAVDHDGSLDADGRPGIFAVRIVSYNDGEVAPGAGNRTNDYLQPVTRDPEQSLRIRWSFTKQR
ncbi:hypothetical protein F5051DRAFT_456051 [Lentinula edodes]|nr:hypothetical protein F5051DRAFT_456051 [Lentinula edodes]